MVFSYDEWKMGRSLYCDAVYCLWSFMLPSGNGPVSYTHLGQDGQVYVSVSSLEYPEAEITVGKDGKVFLPNGNYTYQVSSPGYKSVSGRFTVKDAAFSVPEASLAIQTSWDGSNRTEPGKDSEGTYLITTPDELMWFHDNAELTASARLMSDIRINEEMGQEDASLYTRCV